MDKYCYLNGEILLEKDAKVGIFDIGLLRGYGVYEALTTHNKKPFMLDDHLVRFRNAAKSLDLKVPKTDQEIIEIIDTLIKKNGFAESNIKFILTGGNTINAIEYDFEKPTFYIFIEEFKAVPNTFLTDGCSVITHEHQRQYSESKTINYIMAVKLQKLIREKGAIDALYVSNNLVLECSTSNFFIVKNGKLITANNGSCH
jgi:branched-chain amino acid aminotransferase